MNEWIQANATWVAFGITILLLVYIINAVIKDIHRWLTKKQRPATSPLPYILIVLGYLFCLWILFSGGEIERSAWPQILLMIGLVIITALYARSTEKMAKEMREQRLSEARPYLLLRLYLAENELLQWDIYNKKKPDSFLEVIIQNAGSGPAINLEVSLWNPKQIYFCDSKGYLAPEEKWQTSISRIPDPLSKERWLPQLGEIIKQEYTGIIAVKYSDIHHRVWVSYLCLERFTDVRAEAFVREVEQNIVELNNKD